MNRAFHGTSHLGRGGIELEPLTLKQLVALPITVEELTRWADTFAAKYDVALWNKNDVHARTYEQNMIAITEWANEMAEVLR
jgi:hypothetical protein